MIEKKFIILGLTFKKEKNEHGLPKRSYAVILFNIPLGLVLSERP